MTIACYVLAGLLMALVTLLMSLLSITGSGSGDFQSAFNSVAYMAMYLNWFMTGVIFFIYPFVGGPKIITRTLKLFGIGKSKNPEDDENDLETRFRQMNYGELSPIMTFIAWILPLYRILISILATNIATGTLYGADPVKTTWNLVGLVVLLILSGGLG